MLPRTSSIWQRDSHPTASGKPGAVQLQDPSDTSEFLLTVLLLQMKGFLTRSAELEKVLSPATISAWFDHHAQGALGTFLDKEKISADRAKASLVVNRRPKRTPYRRAKGTPFVEQRDGYDGRTVRAGCGVGRA